MSQKRVTKIKLRRFTLTFQGVDLLARKRVPTYRTIEWLFFGMRANVAREMFLF